MKGAYRIRPQAQTQVRRAACWYDSERNGLGKEFRKAVQRQIAQIAKHPELWGEIADGVRESPVPGFDSYTIIYEVHDDHIYVLSVYHTSRERQDW